ncbi:MAG: hypothetical protein AAF824_14180 [Bacteroidota bacterium]
MNKSDFLTKTKELRSAIEKASSIVEHLGNNLSSVQQPAINAQCNVIRNFLLQVERQEHLFTEMLEKKLKE